MRISDWSSDVCSSDLRGFSPRGMKRTPTRAPSIRQVEGYHALPLRPCDAFEAKAEGATARRGGEAAMIGAAVGDGGRCFAARRALSSAAPAATVTDGAAAVPEAAIGRASWRGEGGQYV